MMESPTKRARTTTTSSGVTLVWADALEDVREEWDEEEFDETEYEVLSNGFLVNEESSFASNSATIFFQGSEIGEARVMLLDRDRPRLDFFESCDCESSELQEISVSFFNRNGKTPRLKALKSLGPEIRRGGFLYISTWRVKKCDDDAEWSDLATKALKALLTCEELRDRWTFAVYIPEPDDARMTPAEARARDKLRMQFRGEVVTEEEKTLARTAIQRLVRLDTTPFLRCGFQQADELLRPHTTPYYFASYSNVASSGEMTHAAATALELARPPTPRAPPSGRDGELLELVRSSAQDPPTTPALEQGIRDLVTQHGASVTGADALHCMLAVALGGRRPPEQQLKDAHIVGVLLGLGGDVNAIDRNGYTPLMVVAASYDPNSNHESAAGFVTSLVASGADKSIEKDGLTALGLMYTTIASANDFMLTFTNPSQQSRSNVKVTAMHALLEPDALTEADHDAAGVYAASRGSPRAPRGGGFLDDDDY